MYSLAVYMEDPCLSLSLSLDGLIRLHVTGYIAWRTLPLSLSLSLNGLIRLHVDYEVMISAKRYELRHVLAAHHGMDVRDSLAYSRRCPAL
jgi:hypothetical protein